MQIDNPYNYNLAVGPQMFFGRKEDVNRIALSLTIFPGDSCALVGGRRMGKTSLLEALLRSVEKPLNDLLLLPIFLDLTGEGIDSVTTFYHVISERVQMRLADQSVNVPALNFNQQQSQPPAPAFARQLESWGRLVKEESGYRLRIILLLDECEQIVERSWTSELYSTLRYLLVGQNTRSLFKIVMAGSHRFLIQVREEGSPLRNVLQYHQLSVLDTAAAKDLVIQPTNGVLPHEVTQRVIIQSGGHPFLTQYLMYHLWEYGLEKVEPSTVDKIAVRFFHERGDFRDWIDGLGLSTKRVYNVLAQANGPISDALVRASLRPIPDNLSQILDALCYHGLVAQLEDRYHIAGEMFHTWFAINYAQRGERIPISTTLESAVVRLQTGTGVIGGSGFVISDDGLVVTCAHVIETLGAQPGERVYLAFQAGGVVLEAEVLRDGWNPQSDIAFLNLLSLLPEGACSSTLGESKNLEGQSIVAFGHPAVGNKNGLWGDGRIVGQVTEANRQFLQLNSSEITVGFSGGPVAVASTGQVIGMVTEIVAGDHYGKLGATAFAIPSEQIRDLCPEPLNLTKTRSARPSSSS